MWIVVFTVLLMTVCGCAARQEEQGGKLVEVTEDKSGEETEEESDKGTKGDGSGGIIYVHVCGEVVSPGVYGLPAGSRLYEAVAAAGGLRENAAGEWLNQAAQARDGQQIYVPSREEAAGRFPDHADGPDDAGGMGMSAGQTADDGKISLNTASKEQLMTLNGIGEAKAASIIRYREEHGGFRKIEELMEVEGIKEGVFNKVKDQIKI
ncbi:MAG: ComEA family DNA-binding protein [Lachnospiraceae bacterium]